MGPTDTLVWTRNPHKFQPYMMKILKTDKQKADWQDKDPIISLVKTWVKENRKPTNTELNYWDPSLQAYRKILAVLKLRPVEGTEKTILVREGLVGRKMDRYCLPSEIANQVINDIHLYHMHLGIDATVRQVQRCVWMPGLHAAVRTELLKCPGCVQKQKIQQDVRVEHCFHTKEKGFASQVVHLDLAGPLPESKEGYKYILGLADHFSAFVMAIAIKSKSHEEVRLASNSAPICSNFAPKFELTFLANMTSKMV